MFLLRFSEPVEATEYQLHVSLIKTKEIGVYDGETYSVTTPQELLDGSWILSEQDGPGRVGVIGDDGYLLSTSNTSILGCWLSPIMAGWKSEPLQITVDNDLEETKSILKKHVDDIAEVERLKYISPGSGQVMEYQQVADEAGRLLTLIQNPSYVVVESDWPMLVASLGIDGDTVQEVASVVYTMHLQWQYVGSAIRAVRLSAKKAIDDAPDEESARLVFDNIVWPSF